jgi:hypothetical protein
MPQELSIECFIVVPRCGRRYAYFESEPGRRAAANLMNKNEAMKIANGIAKLPDLLKRPQY